MAGSPDSWSQSYRAKVRKQAWGRWKKDLRQTQGFLSGIGLAAVAALLFWLSHGHDLEAVREVELVFWTVPALILWLAYRWFRQRDDVHANLAYGRDQELERVKARVAVVEERLRPKLSIDGGDGPAFDWRIPIPEVFWRLEELDQLPSGAYVMEEGLMKVLRISNLSDVGIDKVRVEVKVGAQALPLRWYVGPNNDPDWSGVGPRSDQHVVLGMKAQLGMTVSNGGEHQYETSFGHIGWPEGTIMEVKAWSAGGPGTTRKFRFGLPFAKELLPLTKYPWLPTLSPVNEP
jgi:hypothetical protein